jgi:hypothetical protein
MKYISHYLNKPVRYKKERQGVIKDWVMEATTTHALLAGILVEDKKGQEIIVAMAEVEHLGTRYNNAGPLPPATRAFSWSVISWTSR